MSTKSSLVLRISMVPAVAGLAVVFLSALTILDLGRNRRREEEGMEAKRQMVLPAAASGERVPINENVPEITEDEALEVLKDRPTRAATARLWPMKAHRGTLFRILLDRGAPPEVRILLLGSFEHEDPAKALEAARSIGGEEGQGEGPLLFSAWEILSRFGDRSDLLLFAERSGESQQQKAIREERRDALRERAEPSTRA